MSTRALSFGAVAAAYERFRPDYPDELFAAVAAYAGRPIRTALEIGVGTGKATRLFAAHGVRVTATDPDAAMLAELRKTVPEDVRTIQAAFEELPLGPTYDLVYAAASLHWTRAEGRWERVAALLEPDGVFVSCGGPISLADKAIRDAARAARAPFLASDDIPSPDGTPDHAVMKWPGTELQQSELFTDVRQILVERRMMRSKQDYLGHLSTVSVYIQLPEPVRQQAYDAIAQVLPETVAINADVTVNLARRRTA